MTLSFGRSCLLGGDDELERAGTTGKLGLFVALCKELHSTGFHFEQLKELRNRGRNCLMAFMTVYSKLDFGSML